MNEQIKKIGAILTMVIIVAAVAGLSSCESYKIDIPAVDSLATWSFQSDIQPIFTNNCATISCHGGPQKPDLREGKSYQALTNGLYVTLPADQSPLYKMISTDTEHLSRATETERLKVLYWIKQGAKNN
jgi:hypothetical protein